MANKRDAVLFGEAELRKALQGLERKVQNKILRHALNSGAQVLVKAAKEKVAVETGLLRKSIGTSIRKQKGGGLEARVGPRYGFDKTVKVTDKRTGKTYKQRRNPAMYGHLVEFGTQPHPLGEGSSVRRGVDKGGGTHPGTKAKPYLRPALDAHGDEAIAKTGRRLGELIEAEAGK